MDHFVPDKNIFRIVKGNKVAEDSYWFRKGHSQSRVYGDGDPGTSSKLDKEMREECIRQIQDDLNDLTHLLAFKEKRIQQAEAGWDYRVCKQVTKEIVELNSRKHQLEEEKLGFEKNAWANARLALESDGSTGSSS